MNAENRTKRNSGRQEYFLPAVDAMETSDELVLIADMPGVKPDDLELTVEEGVLTMVGHVTASPVESQETVQQEFVRGDYYRQFRTPRDYTLAKIDASMKNGVVTIRIPREESSKPRKIPVRGE